MQTTRGDATLRTALVISHSTVNRQTTRMPWGNCNRAYLASGGLRAEESIAPDPARDSARGIARLRETPRAHWLRQADTSQR
jgi:hypothetical protein